jgi:apolipoprotein D and lipocalin family protein
VKAIAAAVVLALAGCAFAPSYRDQSVTIASSAGFEPARYVGRWYEIARYPNPFQARCAGAIAEYGADAGGLSVRNICLDETGTPTAQITGRAEVVGPGRLSVRLGAVPFAAPYWVLWVDEGYRVAVVGSPDGRSGWILARDTEPAPDLLTAARAVFEFNGYDLSQLQRSVTP